MVRNSNDDNERPDSRELLGLLLIRGWFSDTPGLSTWNSVTPGPPSLSPLDEN